MFRYVDKPLLLLCLSAMPAVALETSLGIRMETIQSDNILRTRDDAVDEIMYQPGATILVEHQGNSVIASANYDYERRIRTKDYYDDSSALIGRSELTWQALPGRMDFTVSNTRTESTVDRRLGPVQSNLQTTDSTRAGSTLRFRVRQNDELQLQYFHTLTRAQVGATDSNRDTLSASYVLNTGPKDRFTFNVTDNRVDFQESGAPDLNAVTSSVRWNRFGPATELNVQGGWTTMNRSGRDDISEPVWDTGLLWRLTPQMSLRFGVVREVRDRPFILEMGLLPFGSNSQIDSDLNEVFVNNRFEAEWRATFFNNDITLSWVFDRQDYFDILEDQERRTTTLGLRRQLTPKLLVQLEAFHLYDEQLDTGLAKEERWGGSMDLRYTWGPRLSVWLSGSHNTVNAPISLENFDENFYSLRVNYQILE